MATSACPGDDAGDGTDAAEGGRFVEAVRGLSDDCVAEPFVPLASADALPDALYIEGDGRFEFERTVSRLMEMQSPEYLALEHIA